MPSSSITNEDAGKTAVEVLLWPLQIATAVLFFMTAYSKLVGSPAMVGLFDAVGFSQWFRYLTGILETSEESCCSFQDLLASAPGCSSR